MAADLVLMAARSATAAGLDAAQEDFNWDRASLASAASLGSAGYETVLTAGLDAVTGDWGV